MNQILPDTVLRYFALVASLVEIVADDDGRIRLREYAAPEPH